MYGYKDKFFNNDAPGTRRSLWIELIGFDNTAADYTVRNFLDTSGFVPDMVSFLITSISFVLEHNEIDSVLPDYVCSYGGHEYNDERQRQSWTKRQFRSLISELKKHNIKVYLSFFDVVFGKSEYPRVIDKNGNRHEMAHLLKSLDNGAPFNQLFIAKLIETVKYYGFDGVQLADGISSPRLPLQLADYTIKPDSEKMPYKDWVEFNTGLWTEYIRKIVASLKENKIEVAFNSAWTRDPLEAIYRYGTDYKAFQTAGADTFIIEDVSTDFAILSDKDNCYPVDDRYRKLIHHEFCAINMLNKAYVPSLSLTPLCPIRDTHEQWDVLHHMPALMQRAAAANLNNYYVNPDGSLTPVINGPHFCLSDGLNGRDWDYLRLMWDNAYTKDALDVKGATLVWSDAHLKNELSAFYEYKMWHSAKWLSELFMCGGAVHKIVRIENLNAVKGPVLLINPAFLGEAETELIGGYKNGEIISAGITDINFLNPVEHRDDPLNGLWTHPLNFEIGFENDVQTIAGIINEKSKCATVSGDNRSCHITEVELSNGGYRCFIDNELYYYSVPTIHTKNKIKSIEFITKPKGYPKRITDYSFSVRIPPRGMDIVEITYY